MATPRGYPDVLNWSTSIETFCYPYIGCSIWTIIVLWGVVAYPRTICNYENGFHKVYIGPYGSFRATLGFVLLMHGSCSFISGFYFIHMGREGARLLWWQVAPFIREVPCSITWSYIGAWVMTSFAARCSVCKLPHGHTSVCEHSCLCFDNWKLFVWFPPVFTCPCFDLLCVSYLKRSEGTPVDVTSPARDSDQSWQENYWASKYVLSEPLYRDCSQVSFYLVGC